jgi:tetratricopeptide (TPR) repeat protein
MSRLSRKEVKRDEVLETFGSAVGYVRGHGRTMLLAVGAVVVVVLGYLAFTLWNSARQEDANESLAQALGVARAEIDAHDPRPDADPPKFANEAARQARAKDVLESVQREHSGTAPAAVATAYLARMAAEAGELDRARDLWDEVVSEGGDSLLTAEARINRMALDRQQGELAVLADRLRAELDSAESALPKPVLLHQLALALEALGQPEEAREVYQRLAEEHPGSSYAAGAERRAELLAQG